MKDYRFSHDYWHCRGIGCDKHKNCLFYLCYQEIQDNEVNYIVEDNCKEQRKYTHCHIQGVNDEG